MIYPQKLSSRKKDKLINILLICSIAFALILILINKIVSPNIKWAGFANIGLIYIWVTVLYSIKENMNIGSHVLLQMIAMSAVMLYIDNKIGFSGWSVHVGIPIVIIVANVTMLVLGIAMYKKYTKYAIYQLVIVLISLMPIILMIKGIIQIKVLIIIAIGISLLNLTISLMLSHSDFGKMLKCKFHM